MTQPSIYEIAALERRMSRFLNNIPEEYDLSHSYDPVTGNHRFTSYGDYIEGLLLTKAEWQYLLAQYRLLGLLR